MSMSSISPPAQLFSELLLLKSRFWILFTCCDMPSFAIPRVRDRPRDGSRYPRKQIRFIYRHLSRKNSNIQQTFSGLKLDKPKGGSRIFIGGGGGGAQKMMCPHAHYERKTELTFGRGPGPGPWKL